MAEAFKPIAPRPPPVSRRGPWQVLKRHLFDGWLSTLLTIAVLALAVTVLPKLFDWAVLHAVARPDNAACRAAHPAGACWGVVAEKGRLILFGRFPYEEQWRALLASVLLVALLAASCLRAFWKPWLVAAWVAVFGLFFALMKGGVLGLSAVETARWGGLPLTLLLSSVSLVVAFPLAVLVALGRQSQLPAIRSLCVLYVELIRGVPLVSVLFMATFILPLFMPSGGTIDVLARVLIGMTLFTAAYLAEVVRGGLQAIPRGQMEAADALGLNYGQKMGLIVLPQALKIVIPNIVGEFIGLFKDTSLVLIIGLFDLLGIVQTNLSDAKWFSPSTSMTGYVFAGAIFWVFCFGMSRYSQYMEGKLNTSHR